MVHQENVRIVHLHHLLKISGGCLLPAIHQLQKKPLIQQLLSLQVRAPQRYHEIQPQLHLHVR